MRISLLLLSVLLISFNLMGFNLDTVKGNLCIINDGVNLFKIPIESINLEIPNTQIKGKLGSYHFKQKEINRSEPEISFFSENTISISDGHGSMTITINELGLAEVYSNTGSTSISFINNVNEKFFGGGFQFSNVELNGHELYNICEENGIGRGDTPISKWANLIGVRGEKYSSYYPVPFFASSDKRGVSIGSRGLTEVKFKLDQTELTIISEHFTIQFYHEESLLKVIQSFSLLNGRGQNIPQWALGCILGVQGGVERVKQIVTPLIDKGLPIKAIWIQDWVGKRKTSIGSRLDWSWKLDSSYFGVLEYAEENGIKVLGYVNPFFSETGEYTEEGLSKGFFVTELDKAKEFDFGGMKGYMLNIFDPKAFDWMKEIIITNLVETGFDGWMADFAEWYPISQSFEVKIHNDYVHEWVKLNHQIRQESEEELFIFHRSGNWGSANYSQTTWCGDQMTNYGLNDGLPSVMNAMITGGLSGLPATHSDIGGYTSLKKPFLRNVLRSEELMKDWIKLEAFTPYYRSHEGLLPAENLQVYSSEIEDYYIQMALIHERLLPYFLELIQEYKLTGTPVVRHPILLDEKYIDYSFFVGNDIFIQYTEKESYLPNGFREFNLESDGRRVLISIREGSEIENLLFH